MAMALRQWPASASARPRVNSCSAAAVSAKAGSFCAREAKGWQINFNSTNMIETTNTVLPTDQTEYGRGTAEQYSFGNGLDDHTQRLPTWGPRMEGQPVLQYNSPYNVTTGVRTPTPYGSIGANNYKNFLATGALSSDNISLSSSGRNNDIRMSYSHVYQKGTQPNTRINMDVLNLNADYDISERLKVSADINLDRRMDQLESEITVLRQAVRHLQQNNDKKSRNDMGAR